jgi:trimethylamine--corrinoid protein Co-methyltransferase
MGLRNYLTDDETRQLANAAFEVLDDIGVRVESEEARDLLLGNGGARNDDRISIRKQMVNEALDKSRSTFRLFGADGSEGIRLGTNDTYIGPGSDALYQVDQDTGAVRYSTLEDVSANVRLIDGLPNLKFVMSTALPHGITDHLYAKIFGEMVRNTTKPMVVTMTSLDDIKEIHDIAVLVAGDEEGLQERPFFMAYIEPRSPLIFDESSLNRLLYAADHQIPYTYAAGANCGITAPITLQGSVVQGTAESLGGLVIGTLKNPEARFVFGANSAGADMRTVRVSYGNPAWHITAAMYSSLGRYFNLPSWGTGGATDSVRVDAQAGAETEEGIYMAVMYGASLVHDAGFFNYGYLMDAKYLVFVDALIARARYHARALNFDDASLCIEEIARIAGQPAEEGGYAASEFTARHFREHLYIPPEFMRADRVDSGVSAALGNSLLAARNKILTTHNPPVMDPERTRQVSAYLDAL